MSDNDYVREKLFVALTIMSSSQKSLRDRLEDAYISSLMRLKPEDFCDEDQQDFADLEAAMRRVQGEGEGSVQASIAEMTDSEVKLWIEKICSFILDI